jgi:hypothetical protein
MITGTTKDLWGTMTHVSLAMKTIVCGGCGIPFAIPENYFNKLIENNGSFHCPNGCSLHFTGETEVEKLTRQLKQKESELAQKTTANIQLDTQLTKIKKDIASGKCPCCDKTYKHLANHMKNKHPNGR